MKQTFEEKEIPYNLRFLFKLQLPKVKILAKFRYVDLRIWQDMLESLQTGTAQGL